VAGARAGCAAARAVPAIGTAEKPRAADFRRSRRDAIGGASFGVVGALGSFGGLWDGGSVEGGEEVVCVVGEEAFGCGLGVLG